MKLKLLLAGVLAATVGVSLAAPVALAKKPPTTGSGCKPRIAVILKGTLAAPPSTNAIWVTVTSANRWGRAYVGGSPKLIDASGAKVRGEGKKALADLKSGDRVLVQARVCKADLANGAMPPLAATKVIAHSAKSTSATNDTKNNDKNNKNDKNENDQDDD